MAGAGYKNWTAGDIPSAVEFDTLIQEQTVMVFASAAARDTALSVVKAEGMHTYLLDTNTLTVYSGSVWSTVGPVHGALTSWTPTLTQSGTVTKTVTHGSYRRAGRDVAARCLLAITGSGTAANLITVSLPVAATGDGLNVGHGHCIRGGVFQFVFALTTGSGAIVYMDVTTGSGTETSLRVGTGATAGTNGLAGGDTIALNLQYEAAADA